MSSGTSINPMAADLAPYKLDPPASVRLPRIRKAAKRCFELSGRFALDHPSATVVHGFVQGWIAHGWAEIDGMVYDGTCKGIFDRDGYYRAARAVAVRRFPAAEYLDIACACGYWLPCDELSQYARAHLEGEA